jgi:hypothetical protein
LFEYTPGWHALAGAGLAFLFWHFYFALYLTFDVSTSYGGLCYGWFAVLWFDFFLLFVLALICCSLRF